MGDEVEPAEIFAISESTLKKKIRLDGCQVADWIVGERAKGRATETNSQLDYICSSRALTITKPK